MNVETREFNPIITEDDEKAMQGMPVFVIGQKFFIGNVEFQIDKVRRRSLVITPTDKTWEGLLNKPETLKRGT